MPAWKKYVEIYILYSKNVINVIENIRKTFLIIKGLIKEVNPKNLYSTMYTK